MTSFSRRRFLQVTGGAGMAVLTPLARPDQAAAAPTGSLGPDAIAKYVTSLVIPPRMPMTARGRVDYYEIAVRQFRQQVLPPGLPATTVWGYGSIHHPGTFNFPAYTIEARFNRPVRVAWINELVDRHGNFLPHLLPVDPTLHWANPPGGLAGRDGDSQFESTPGPYRGPVPTVTHLHGSHAPDHSDGHAEAWYLPRATNTPSGYARAGTFYDYFRRHSPLGRLWGPGRAVFEYPNDQRAATLWYHDHTLGLTRLNVYAGPAGFYLLRHGPGDLPAGVLPGPGPSLEQGPRGAGTYEIPLVIQDRSFNANGSLFYPASRAFFDDFAGPYVPDSDVSPIWNPEFFGNTMVVNGRTWPVLEVEPRRYRFRILNGCNARFLVLAITRDAVARPAATAVPFWMIGAEGGFLAAPVRLEHLFMAPAERRDVVVDFTGLRPGTVLYLVNLGPDEPFGELTEPSESVADPATTGQVMKFVVRPLRSHDTSSPPARLHLPAMESVGEPTARRRVSLNERPSRFPGCDGPVEAQLGTVRGIDGPVPLGWDEPITENPALGSVEVWEIYNLTADAHPIHLHQVHFHVLDRTAFDSDRQQAAFPWERGLKDTVVAFPGQITRLKAHFDLPGRYAWHCHILEHEDNEMMRPFHVGRLPGDLPS